MPFLCAAVTATILAVFSGTVSAFALPESERALLDSLFRLESVERRAAVYETDSAYYYGAVFRTMMVPFDTLVRRLREPGKVTASMGMIRRFEKIPLDPPRARFGTFDFEARVLMARGWCLINLDSLEIDPAGLFCVVMNGEDDSVLVRAFGPGHRGLFSIKCDGFHMRWRIEKRGSGASRVGVMTWMAPRAYVPHWLYTFIAERALPGVLEDFEKGMLRPSHGLP